MNILKTTKLASALGVVAISMLLPSKATACYSDSFIDGMCAFGGSFAK